MMFRSHTPEGIRDGQITLAFRRWKKVSAKEGGLQKTHVGVIKFGKVKEVSEKQITNADAIASGVSSKAELLEDLSKYGEGPIYRIEVSFAGADPRIALRENDDISEDEIAEIRRRLDRLDNASPIGAWTRTVLTLIEHYPAVRAADLAKMFRQETAPFKINVRKLKNLGLTQSLEIGYRLSPRGRRILDSL